MIRALDIFCGAGGSSAGARAAGVEVRGGIDLDALATATFEANFPNAQVITDRLEDVDLTDLKRSVGNVDLLLASPECTNHTCAKGSAPKDEASRATAMYVLYYIETFKPRWFVLENVVHMRPWTRYGELKQRLVELGYHVDEQVLDASELGVPQKRRRLFLVGDRAAPPNLVTIKRKRKERTVASILDEHGTWKTNPLRTEKRAADTLARADRAIQALGHDTPFLIVYYGTDGSGGWQNIDRPLRTITTIDRFALVTPGVDGHRMRMLQVPELRRAMGFKNNYRFDFGSRRDRIRLLGNGVCPPVMESVVRSLTQEH